MAHRSVRTWLRAGVMGTVPGRRRSSGHTNKPQHPLHPWQNSTHTSSMSTRPPAGSARAWPTGRPECRSPAGSAWAATGPPAAAPTGQGAQVKGQRHGLLSIAPSCLLIWAAAAPLSGLGQNVLHRWSSGCPKPARPPAPQHPTPPTWNHSSAGRASKQSFMIFFCTGPGM
jgi:hypothetical protein